MNSARVPPLAPLATIGDSIQDFLDHTLGNAPKPSTTDFIFRNTAPDQSDYGLQAPENSIPVTPPPAANASAHRAVHSIPFPHLPVPHSA
jgi:hypothetical protein